MLIQLKSKNKLKMSIYWLINKCGSSIEWNTVDLINIDLNCMAPHIHGYFFDSKYYFTIGSMIGWAHWCRETIDMESWLKMMLTLTLPCSRVNYISNEKRWSTNISYGTEEQKLYGKEIWYGNKAVIKYHILHNCISIKCP